MTIRHGEIAEKTATCFFVLGSGWIAKERVIVGQT